MIINIQDDILILHNHGILKRLLEDKTTKKNIMWATDAYNDFGAQYYRNEEIKPELITGRNSDIIKTRARKELEKQFERTRQRAEVFTPLWICKLMNDAAERFWIEDNVPITEHDDGTDYIGRISKDNKLFKKYVDSKRLEITCGEAPYLVSRYDVATGEMIPVKKRIGILDRKLQVISRYAQDEKEWLKWVIRAYQATFGYEFQGDNVLIARVNLLMSLDEYMEDRWGRRPTDKEYEKIANIVAWNIWQMDGLSYTIPFSKAEEHVVQLDIFGLLQDEDETELQEEETVSIQPYCRIYDWHNKKKSIEFQELKKGMHMKFDFIIGNPPYQEDTESESTRKLPIYNNFMDETYGIAKVVELITPARFLFNAGQTPKAWNQKMLEDPHLKVLYFEQDASKIFPNTDIKGGVAITYRDEEKEYGPIRAFVPYEELRTVLEKAGAKTVGDSLTDIADSSNVYDLKNIYADHPDYRKYVGDGGRHSQLKTNVLNINPIFTDQPTEQDDYLVYGLVNGKRGTKYCHRRYLKSEHKSLFKYKVLVPKAAGSGKFGDVFPEMIVVKPETAFTQTYISIGTFDDETEAKNLSLYLKTKFCRALLYVLKVTQDNLPAAWRYVPKQDFSDNSDIDWSQSIADIDRQLYAKYGLDQNEINFIESHVKEMK